MKQATRMMVAREGPKATAALLSQLWLFAMLNTVFRDIHEMAKAETIEEILSGYLNGNPVTEGVLLVGGVLVELPLLMILLGHVVSGVAYRRLNLVLAPLALVGVLASYPNDPDDYFFVVVCAGAL